jgi:hypothetical protein
MQISNYQTFNVLPLENSSEEKERTNQKRSREDNDLCENNKRFKIEPLSLFSIPLEILHPEFSKFPRETKRALLMVSKASYSLAMQLFANDIFSFKSLEIAFKNNSESTVFHLLQNSEIDKIDLTQKQNIAMKTAIIKGYTQAVAILLNKLEKIHFLQNSLDIVGAIARGHKQTVKILFEDPRIQPDDEMLTKILCKAIDNGDIEMVELILLQRKQYQLPIQEFEVCQAIRSRESRILKLILETQATFVDCEDLENPSVLDLAGGRLLKEAIQQCDIDMVKLLLASEQVKGFTQQEVLMAIESQNIEIVELLLTDSRVDQFVNHEALKSACLNGDRRMIQLLLEKTRVNPCDDNYSAIFCVYDFLISQRQEMLRWLLKDHRLISNLTDLMCQAIEKGRRSLVEFLIKDQEFHSLIDPSANSNQMLILAMQNDQAAIVELLLTDSRVLELLSTYSEADALNFFKYVFISWQKYQSSPMSNTTYGYDTRYEKIVDVLFANLKSLNPHQLFQEDIIRFHVKHLLQVLVHPAFNFSRLAKKIEEDMEVIGNLKLENGKLTGEGTIRFLINVTSMEKKQITIEGEFKEGKLHGKGIVITDQEVAKGEFKEGKLHGPGLIQTKQQLIEGIFKEGCLNGKGFYKSQERLFVGEFKEGKLHGEGRYCLTMPFIPYPHQGAGIFKHGNLVGGKMTKRIDLI